jgi:ribosomal protein L40E
MALVSHKWYNYPNGKRSPGGVGSTPGASHERISFMTASDHITRTKICTRCGVELPLSRFKERSDCPGRFRGACIDCERARLRHLYRSDPAYAARKRAHRSNKRQYGEKDRARKRLLHALRMGYVVKPAACSRCGATTKIQGHHEDYERPLDVVWLCSCCHGERHRKTEGA